jgi:hypothetical protein
MVWPSPQAPKPLEMRTFGIALPRSTILERLLHPRLERVDELAHVVGGLAGVVGGGQALDELQPPVAVRDMFEERLDPLRRL